MNFEKLFKAEFAALGGLISSLVPDSGDVEMILRESFARLWDKRDIVVQPEAVHDFLENAALSGAVRYMVDHRKQGTVPHPAQGELAEIVAALPTHARAVFVLARESEQDFAEIGEMLDLGPETVEKQLGKALRLIYTGMTGEKMPASGFDLKSWASTCTAIGKSLAGQADADDLAASALLTRFRGWWEAAASIRPEFVTDASEQWGLFVEVVPEAKGGKIVDKAAVRRRKKRMRKWGLRLLMLAVATAIAAWIVL